VSLSVAVLMTTMLLSAGDFDLKNSEWNGLAYLKITAREAKVTLKVVNRLRWDTVVRDDVLLFLSPSTEIHGAQLLKFAEDGGKATVVVDRGGATALLAPFGLTLTKGPVIHSEYYRDHPDFPTLKPKDKSFLWFNIEHIVLNHPAAFSTASKPNGRITLTPIIEFAEPGQAFAVSATIGEGEVIFISDASVFINEMQQHVYGDKQFVANILRYHCTRDQCQAQFIGSGATATGVYTSQAESGIAGLEKLFRRAIAELNDMAPLANAAMSEQHAIAQLSLIIAFLVLLFVLWQLRRPATLQPAWHYSEKARRTRVEHWTAALVHAKGSADYFEPTWALARRFWLLLSGERNGLSESDLSSPALREGAAERLASGPLGKHYDAIHHCLEMKHRFLTGSDNNVTATSPRPVVTFDEFDRLWNDYIAVHDVMRGSNQARNDA
jgi:hypothetical protein